MASGALGEWGERLGARVGEFSASIHFLTRLPLPRHEGAAGANLAQAAWAFPLAGFVVGLIGAIASALAHKFVVFSLAGGGADSGGDAVGHRRAARRRARRHRRRLRRRRHAEQKLAIMRDARIGTYGVCALILSLLIRADAIASLTEIALVAPALIAAHVGARAVLPFVMFLLPAARSDGLAFAAGAPSGMSVAIAAALAILALLFCLGLAHALVALVVLAIVVSLLCWLATRQIGGQTGDVLGAVEQVERDRHFAGGVAVTTRHCERSEAIQRLRKNSDCFVAPLLAMTRIKRCTSLPCTSWPTDGMAPFMSA